MCERAYSIELNKEISAKRASELAHEGKLKDKRLFKCIDEDCGISLTCSNWEQPGKRYYFRPSCNDELHVIGCSQVSVREAKEQEKREIEGAISTARKDGTIRVMKCETNSRRNIAPVKENNPGNSRSSSRNNSSQKKYHSETRNIYSLASIVDLYYGDNFPKEKNNIRIDSDKISLNEFFKKSNSKLILQKHRVFFGKAFLKTTNFKDSMLEIEFLDSNLPKIYTNIEVLKKKVFPELLKYNDKNISVETYYRARIINENGKMKFIPFNKLTYKDLYFRI